MDERFVLMKLVNLVGDLVGSEVLVAGAFSEAAEEEEVVGMVVVNVAMAARGATAVAVVVMVVVTVVMEAEIGVMAVVKGAMAAVVATPTGVEATQVVVEAVEDTETTGTRVVMSVLLLAPIETAMTAMLHKSKKKS